MARPYDRESSRWPDERRRWSEGEEIRSAPGARYGRYERARHGEGYDGTADMDFGGGYGGGEARGGGRRHGAGIRDRDERWGDDRERWSSHDQGRGGGYRGGWGGTGEYGSSTGGYGASGLTGSTGRWGPGGAGYSGSELRHGVSRLTGRGPKGYRRSDDRIREDVCERIARSGLDAENVEVHVDNGEVTLAGEVESRMDKRRLEDVVDDVFGVDEVHNHLRLRREGSGTADSRSGDPAQGDDGGLPH